MTGQNVLPISANKLFAAEYTVFVLVEVFEAFFETWPAFQSVLVFFQRQVLVLKLE